MPVRTNSSVRAHVCIMRYGSITLKRAVGQENQPVGAGVWVVVLTGFAWTEYARLCGVHSFSSSLWAVLRGASSPAGPFLVCTPYILLYFTWFYNKFGV